MLMTSATISAVGGRERNEDAYGEASAGGCTCWVVADGLGGHRGGDIASKLAVDTILACFEKSPEVSNGTVRGCLDAAHEALRSEQARESALDSLQSTAVVLIADEQAAIWGHVGDSRLYLFRRAELLFRTSDHSVVQRLVDAGEICSSELARHPDRNRLLASLGMKGDFRPTILNEPLRLEPGDVALLCGDGFWEHVTSMEMEIDLTKASSPNEWLSCMEARLLHRSSERSDNYTCTAVCFPGRLEPGTPQTIQKSDSTVVPWMRLLLVLILGVILGLLPVLFHRVFPPAQGAVTNEETLGNAGDSGDAQPPSDRT